ncbi:hypothetical protein Tco_0873888 [Tanacetum coccineum]|uniref:Uncharacterized protein n=1 Tax=Tanacetum coccineum TaxID=301880 RepID=A0ABQ5BMX9_9ASTR
MENYKNVSQDIRNQLDAEAKAVSDIFLHREKINDITPLFMLVQNACERVESKSRDGESTMNLINSRYHKMMNELSQELKTVSYHKLYDILKQHHNEVNEIRAKRLAHTANPLELVA